MKVVLSGSGMRYPAFVGALNAIQQCGHMPTHIAGTSGGGIVATAFASGYRGDSLEKLVMDTLPSTNNLLDRNYWPFSKPYGLYKGNKLLAMFRDKFPSRIHHTNIPLSIVTCDLGIREPVIWNNDNAKTKDLAVLVRATMSIPFVFDYVKIDGQLHVDGGIANNFPIDMYGNGDDVIGVKIVSNNNVKRKPINGLTDYSLSILDSMLEAHEKEHIEDAMFARTVFIKTDVSSLDFNLTHAQADALIESGYAQTMQQLKRKVQ